MTVSREEMLVDPRLTKLAEDAAKTIARAERLDNVSAKEIYRTIIDTILAALRAAAELDHRTSGEPEGTTELVAPHEAINRVVDAISVEMMKELVSAASHSQEGMHTNEAHVDVLPDGSCIPAISDDALWALASALHSNIPEDQRPMGWSDFSPEQVQRLRDAAKVFIWKYRASQAGSEASSGPGRQEIIDQITFGFKRGWSPADIADEIIRLGDPIGHVDVTRPAPEQAAQGDVAKPGKTK